jgi:short-subunit dehydrogenase
MFDFLRNWVYIQVKLPARNGVKMTAFVFISGATGGLGKAFAVECASRGWNLFLTDLNLHRLETLTEGIQRTYGVKVVSHACDLADHQARSALFAHIAETEATFHMLVNVAGVEYEGLFQSRSREEIRTIVRVNIESTLDVTHTLLDRVSPGQPLHIITVSSLAAFYPMPVKATYAASKRFLLDFFMALRDEIKEYGSTVTILCPAGMPTTPGSIEGIQAQGLMGHLTTSDVGKVAAKTIDSALRGKAIVIPGFLNQVLQFLGSLLPPVSIASLVGNRWRSARKRRTSLQTLADAASR